MSRGVNRISFSNEGRRIMSGVDKVEYLKKHGPFRQYNRAIQFNAKTGKMIIVDSLRAKLKSKPTK